MVVNSLMIINRTTPKYLVNTPKRNKLANKAKEEAPKVTRRISTNDK